MKKRYRNQAVAWP